MTSITLRRHILRFYLPIIFAAAFYLGMGVFLTRLFITHNRQGILKPIEYFLPLFCLLIFFMAFYTVYRYYRNAPIVNITGGFISFNHDTYSLSDIQKIEFTGKRDFPYIFDFPMEALTLHLRDGHSRFVYDDMYHNMWQLKQYLKQVVIDKKSFTVHECLPVGRNEANHEMYDAFSNNQFLSLRGISLWGLISIFLFMVRDSNIQVTIFVFCFCLFWFVLHGWLMHYFEMSDQFLTVRNHIFIWKRKSYRLSDIKEVIFETRGKMPNCMRIVTRDFNTKLYPAGTLRDDTWLALEAKLNDKKIKVRNECI